MSGYFIESAINHYTLTDGKDLRLYNAAKKLADCWVANIGPGKKDWFDGHQEMEQALVRFGRFVNDRKATTAAMLISRSRSSSSIRAAADRNTTRAICRRASSMRRSATPSARPTSIRAWPISPPKRTTRITRAR